IDAHRTIPVERMIRTSRLVYGNLEMIHAQTVTLSITIGKKTTLKHLIRREADAGNNIGGIKSCLFHISMVIFRVFVQFKFTHRNQRKVFFRPDFGKIKRMKAVRFSLLFCHNLNVQFPLWEIASFNGVEKVSLCRFSVVSDNRSCLFVAQVFYSLLCAEMKLHPMPHVIPVYKTVGMTSETVHVPVSVWNSAVAHHNGDLM